MKDLDARLTSNWLFREEVMRHQDDAGFAFFGPGLCAADRMLQHFRAILQHDAVRKIWEYAAECDGVVSEAAANIDKHWRFL